jgi:hypothetical protein
VTTTGKPRAKRSGKVQESEGPPAVPEISGRPKPDWETWRCIPQTALYVAVALSCDIDPYGIQVLDDVQQPDLREFYRRLHIAVANLRVRLRVRKIPEDMPEWVWAIDLAEFAFWAEGLGWPLPAEFPRAAAGTPQPPPWPWGQYQTKLLGLLADAVRQFWMKRDPSKPGPQNKTVIAWLEEHGVKHRTAEEMAKIIHAD